MVNEQKGTLDATGMRVGVVVSRFNEEVSRRLLEGALEALQRMGAAGADITVVWVPGAFEIPIAARELAEHGDVDAVVCLGAVIRGETAHFDHVAGEAARGVASIHATTGVPAGFGVLVAVSAYQIYDAISGNFAREQKDQHMGKDERRVFLLLGRVGLTARALVFVLIGYFVIRTAFDFNPKAAVGVDGALSRLHHQPLGPWLVGLVAVGLLVFATFSFFEARYRRL